MAYYSQQGATIMQGVGSFFDGAKAPRPSSFKDGVFGAPQATDPGALMAFQDGSLGAYFGGDIASEPRAFQDGSLGSYFDGMARPARPERYALQGKLMAYQDGTFGRYIPDSSGPGEEKAFEGGIFHALGMPLFVDGKQITGPMTIQHGTPPEDQVMAVAQQLAEQMVIKEGGMVATPTEHLGFPEGSPRAYMDGSLGPESGFIAEDLPNGPLLAYDEGVLGMQHVPMSGLGFWDKSGNGFVIDMTDPQWVKELKAAVVMSLTSLGITEPLNTLDEDWYVSPYWNGKASGMTREWAEVYQEKVNPAASKGLLIRDTGKVAYPTVTGIVNLVQSGVGISAEFNPTSFPKLYAFMQEVAKLGEGETLDSFTIVAPFASEGDKIRKGGIMSVSTVSMVALGGVAVLAIGFIGYNLLRK